ncbi:MAG TPA: hypothetical protein DEA62_05000 [Coxiellaceae bacterium]|nr:MAG: hypothetical protein A2V89_00615 [Gammaproteobacteria bacterium RBG_16_37_9]HBS52315.1 hypothetical protein [Coxiellaceae bacterium]
MRKILLAASTMIFLMFGSSVFAEMKIGVINYEKVVVESPQLAAAKADFKKKFEPREKEINEAQKKFQDEIAAFSKDSPTMKEDAKKAAQQKIMEQQKKLQEMQAKFQKDATTAQNDTMNNILKKVEDVINKIAADQKFDLVIAKTSVPYSKKELDITDEVIKQVKNKK